MEERKSVKLKKDEFAIKEYVKKNLGKGKASKVTIEYTPVGEKIVVSTSRPGLVIGRGGEKIEELTRVLKKEFKLGNPKIEIDQIQEPEFDSQLMADSIALALEKKGPLKFKVIAYRTLQKIMDMGALGVEIRLSGKLPGARAKSWRFAQGYLKKTGETKGIVDKAQSIAQTRPGTVGVKVSIISPHAKLQDRINIDEELIKKLKENSEEKIEENKTTKKKSTKKTKGKKE
jgi:small subunit ribosomal protein S3